MARLYRPHIPLRVRVSVASRQLADLGRHDLVLCVEKSTEACGSRLEVLLAYLAGAIGCPRDQLRLDHHPPLAARAKSYGMRGTKPTYIPDANDPDHLFYRPHGPEFDGSHLIKTNVRGDHGQHPDRVLIKKMRRIERGPRPKRQPGFKKKNPKVPKRKWPSRPFSTSKGRT